MNELIRYGATEHFFSEASLYPGLFLARVISQYKNFYKLMTEGGECLAEVSGRFRYETVRLSDYPAVGDFVMTDHTQSDKGNAVIHKILTRKSIFERAIQGGDQTQVIAANIDTIFICMSLNNDYNLSRLERYLSSAWNSGATPVVVLTKSDLFENSGDVINEISDVAPGTDVLATSSLNQVSLDKLLPYLQPGTTSSFVGSSGVGKSTLINRLMGKEVLTTSGVRKDDKGRHTTTRKELLLLPGGGVVIDTPGMREFGVESVDLSKSFSDIDNLSQKCRFSDCTHSSEPGCAVKQALEDGILSPRRLESYQKLKREARYDGLSFKQIEVQKLNTMFEGIGGMKNARRYVRKNNKKVD